MRREIRFGNEICISSLILRSATDLRGECLMENLHDRIKDGITCAYKFFSQFSESLENRSSCTIFQAGTQNVAQDFSYLSKERSFGWRDFDRGKKRGERNLFVLSDEEMAFRNGDYVKDLSRDTFLWIDRHNLDRPPTRRANRYLRVALRAAPLGIVARFSRGDVWQVKGVVKGHEAIFFFFFFSPSREAPFLLLLFFSPPRSNDGIRC